MKKIMTIAALGVVLTVAGCVEDGSVSREAGNWKLDRKLVKFEMPGMPPEERDRMVAMMSNNPSVNRCVTQEQVDQEGPLSELLGRTAMGAAQCNWSKMAIVKGKVDIAGACTLKDQAYDLTVTGTALAGKTDITITTDGKKPVGKVIFTMTDERTGPCTLGAATGG